VAFSTQDIGLRDIDFLTKTVNWIKKLSMIQGVTALREVPYPSWRQLLPTVGARADFQGAGDAEKTGISAGRQEMPGFLPGKCQLAGKKQPCQ
jgi:hypothetical protein